LTNGYISDEVAANSSLYEERFRYLKFSVV